LTNISALEDVKEGKINPGQSIKHIFFSNIFKDGSPGKNKV
jgi:hypothetical protein